MVDVDIIVLVIVYRVDVQNFFEEVLYAPIV